MGELGFVGERERDVDYRVVVYGGEVLECRVAGGLDLRGGAREPSPWDREGFVG